MNHPNTGSVSAISVSPLHPQQQQQQQSHTIFVPTATPPPPPPVPQPPNLPRLDLLQGHRDAYMHVCVTLYEAAMKGDWKAAKPILNLQPDLIRFAITDNHDTLLHIAVSAENTKAVEEFMINLVRLMEIEDLELQNKSYDTALTLSAIAGNVKAAKILVIKNPILAEIPGRNVKMPLYLAALFAKPDMVRYLYFISNKMSGDLWTNDKRGRVLLKCVEAEIFDVALNIINDCPELTNQNGLLSDVLLALAHKPRAFEMKEPASIFTNINKSRFHSTVRRENECMLFYKIILDKLAIMPKRDIDDILRGPPLKQGSGIKGYPSRVLFHAAKTGNTGFVAQLLRLYPDQIWKQDDKGKTIFHLAIKHRHIEIYNMLYQIGGWKESITLIADNRGNTLLHMAAKRGIHKKLQNTSGGFVLEMQQELLWFSHVEKIVPPHYGQKKNMDGKTPADLFTRTHEDLLADSKVLLKDISSQCMLVTTLIATMVFTSTFTFPGGYNNNTGVPVFRQKPLLMVFFISNAISLLSSLTSLFIFLSIILSNHEERHFLASLPNKLANGLATLFFSVVPMIVAFSASFFMMYDKKLEWIPVTITTLFATPVILFTNLQYGLFKSVFTSAYRYNYIIGPKKRIIS